MEDPPRFFSATATVSSERQGQPKVVLRVVLQLNGDLHAKNVQFEILFLHYLSISNFLFTWKGSAESNHKLHCRLCCLHPSGQNDTKLSE